MDKFRCRPSVRSFPYPKKATAADRSRRLLLPAPANATPNRSTRGSVPEIRSAPKTICVPPSARRTNYSRLFFQQVRQAAPTHPKGWGNSPRAGSRRTAAAFPRLQRRQRREFVAQRHRGLIYPFRNHSRFVSHFRLRRNAFFHARITQLPQNRQRHFFRLLAFFAGRTHARGAPLLARASANHLPRFAQQNFMHAVERLAEPDPSGICVI